MVTATAPESTETGVASTAAMPATVAATDSTEFPAAEPKKTPKKPHKTAHRQQPQQFFNPFSFFASGPNNGYRRF
jgi:hypothetical protein